MIGMLDVCARWCKKHFTSRIACLAIAFFLPIYYWAPLVNNSWDGIDDHEIMQFIGERDRASIADIPRILQQTELTSTATLPRYRPTYYSLRIIESIFFGKNVTFWYLTRIFIALYLSITITQICLRFFGPLVASGFLIWVLSEPYWTGIFGRAGPGETYCVLGICLICSGLMKFTTEERNNYSYFLILLGTVIAVGSKENFIAMGFIPLVLFFKQKDKWKIKSLLSLLTFFYAFLIGAIVIYRLKLNGSDVYETSSSIGDKITILFAIIKVKTVYMWIGLIFIMGLCIFYFKHVFYISKNISHQEKIKGLIAYFNISLILLTIYLLQYIFYSTQWPNHVVSRYLFPGIISLQIFILMACFFVKKLVQIFYSNSILYRSFNKILAIIFISLSIPQFNENRIETEKIVASTKAHYDDIKKISQYLISHPNHALVITSYQVVNYEGIFSLAYFIRSMGAHNQIAIEVSGYDTNDFLDAPLNMKLTKKIIDISNQGLPNYFSPITSVANQPCYSVGLSGPPIQRCDAGIQRQ